MNYNPEEIQTLIIAKILGDISDQDNIYLDELITTNENVRLLYQDMKSTFDSPDAIKARERLDQKINYTDLIPDKRNLRRSYIFAFGAAAALLVIIGIYTVVKTSAPAPITLN